MKRLALAVVFVLAGAGAVSAQSWDSPSFMSPVQGDDVGVYFVDGDVADWGLQGIWRQTGNLNLGIRGGVLGGRLEGFFCCRVNGFDEAVFERIH